MATTPVYGLLLPTVAADSGIWGGENNTLHNGWDGEIARPRVPFLSPTVGATTTCDLNQTTGARVFVFTVSQATTLAFSNVPTSSFDCRVTLIITNGSAFVLTFPASVTWPTGIAPTLKAAGTDIVDLETKDGGTTWLATLRNNPRPGVVAQFGTLTTTSGVEVSLASYTLPANALSVNGQRVRVTLGGLSPLGGATVKVKFGATDVTNGLAPGANEVFYFQTMIARTGAATQFATGLTVKTATVSLQRAGAAETLSSAVLIDVRANVTTGGQTLAVDSVLIEYLAA